MSFSVSGIGSGLDIHTMVDDLVAAERAPTENRLDRREESLQAQLSAYGMLQGALSGFQIATNRLAGTAGDTMYDARNTSSSHSELFTATAANGTALGSHAIEVIELAAEQKIASQGFAADEAIGTGTLVIGAGEEWSFSVDIDEDSNTLSGIRDAINAAPGNEQVRASLINTDEGQRLVLTGTETGKENAFTVTASGGDGGLAQLNYLDPADPAAEGNAMGQVTAANDAHIKVEGFDLYSASNTVENAIDGVSLNLHAADPGTVGTLAIEQDNETVSAAARIFVEEWNKLSTTMRELGRVNQETGTGSVLTGDATMRSIDNQLRRELQNPAGLPDDPYGGTLSAIGITMQLDGTLSIDESKLNEALQSDPNAVATIFNGDNGYATRLKNAVDPMLERNGTLAIRSDGLQNDLHEIEDQRENLDRRMEAVERRYMTQFTALDSYIAQMNSTSEFLSQQLESLNNNK